MLEMITKMSVITAAYVVLTVLLWKYTKDKKLTTAQRVGIGLVYGFMSILSTHFGVDYVDMLLNVRDLGPMCAGLFFDPAAGILAGMIGGIERYIAGTYLGIGAYTRVACSISTCIAGLFAAFMNIVIFNRKRPSTTYAFFMGAVIEVFHMYAVFITHRDDMEMAFTVVKTCAIPMIIFSALGLAASAGIINGMSGRHQNPFRKIPREEVPVSHKFQVWLFVVTMGVFALSFGLNYLVQTQAALQEAKTDLILEVADLSDTYDVIRKHNGNISHMYGHVGNSGNFTVLDADGNVIAGDFEDEKSSEQLFGSAAVCADGGFFEEDIAGMHWLCTSRTMSDGAVLIAMLPDDEIYDSRDMQTYETVLADILLFTAIYILISLLVQLIVVNNLELINKSLAKITGGDLDERVSVYESSEFASLSDDINQTVHVLKGYIAAAEKRIEQELILAHSIQDAALPKTFDFTHKGFEIFATMDPAKEVGGDFYDFFFVEADTMAMVIADVSGKGIPAALFMMRSKTAIRGLAETGNELVDIFERVNKELCDGNEVNMFVTVWMGMIDLKTGIIKCINAGHEYPAIMRSGGSYELYKEKHSMPLGAMEGVRFTEYEMKLEPGDCLYVYTDGVPEAINMAEEQYGTERMLSVLSRESDGSMSELLPAVKEDMDAFVGKADQFDDITMIGFRYKGMNDNE